MARPQIDPAGTPPPAPDAGAASPDRYPACGDPPRIVMTYAILRRAGAEDWCRPGASHPCPLWLTPEDWFPEEGVRVMEQVRAAGGQAELYATHVEFTLPGVGTAADAERALRAAGIGPAFVRI